MAGSDQAAFDLLRACAADFKQLIPNEIRIHDLASDLHGRNRRLPQRDFTEKLKTDLDAVLPHIGDPQTMARLLMIVAAIRSMTDGRAQSLLYLVAQMCNLELADIPSRTIGAYLDNLGWFADIDANLLDRIAQPYAPSEHDGNDAATWKADRMLGLLDLACR